MGRDQKKREEHSGEELDRPVSVETPYNKLIVIGLLQFMGNFATNLSIQAMSVSFTHVVKATEVIFVLLWSYSLVHYGIITRVVTITKSQVLVIIVITLGVMIASLKEASFSWHGLIFGMLANIGFSGRNTLSKWVMSNHDISKERVFVIASFVSCIPCIFPVLMFELPALAILPRSAYLSIFYTSVMYFLYNTVSFTVLEGVSPVTHAIANCCKRLFIVVISIMVFRTVVQPSNIVGSLIAIFGVALYSQLGSGQTLASIVKKNLLFIVLGSLIVGGVLFMPRDATGIPKTGSETVELSSDAVIVGSDSLSSSSLAPVIYPEPPVSQLEKFVPKRRGNSELIKHLQSEIVRLVRPHLKGYKRIVMLDVPDHNNKGDSAIFTGEENFLRLMNLELIYACSDAGKFKCNTKYVKELIGDKKKETLVGLHGGGNFGDLWEWVVNERNNFINDLVGEGYDFMMFPQTITFKDKGKIPYVQKLYGRMKKLVFMVRDVPSYEFMKQYFPNSTNIYLPDMAWMNGHKEIVRIPQYDILFFLRKDYEGDQNLAGKVRARMKELPEVDYNIADWTDYDIPDGNPSLVDKNYDRFYMGLDFLTQARVVVTNRLHGHILSTLLDLPHVIVDNIYGKVFDNHNAWTRNATGVEMAENIDEAMDKALDMLADLNTEYESHD
eukprot:Phypoly_transcript_04092.p1 GENE.Phypoly_transcript_04092~~Phypoly_transcript_04092.p1  ORF type:complete len:731 (-),score=94.91 Phypoly_transcript_04092:77-2083(-)